MNKQTTNRIVDLLSKLADNLAEQERTVRALATEIQTLKYDVTPEELAKPAKEDTMTSIERLLKELLEEKKQQKPKFPFDTHPYPPYLDYLLKPVEPICGGKGLPQVNLCTNSTYAGIDKSVITKLSKA